jgi:hypothetical protein
VQGMLTRSAHCHATCFHPWPVARPLTVAEMPLTAIPGRHRPASAAATHPASLGRLADGIRDCRRSRVTFHLILTGRAACAKRSVSTPSDAPKPIREPAGRMLVGAPDVRGARSPLGLLRRFGVVPDLV